MDVRIEAAAMEATAEVVMAVVTVTRIIHKALSQIESVASFSCPSISGHSLSAVAPDHTLMKGLARAA